MHTNATGVVLACASSSQSFNRSFQQSLIQSFTQTDCCIARCRRDDTMVARRMSSSSGSSGSLAKHASSTMPRALRWS